MTAALGKVEIKTTEDLPSLNNLVLVHPWLRCLLDPVPPFEDLDVDILEPLIPLDVVGGDRSSDSLPTDVHSPSSSHIVSPSRHSSQPRLDKLTRALRFFARLRQPFGALLLAPLSHSEYKRVASDNPIVVQLRKDVLPRHLVQMTRSLDIL
ncbi:hypothetical protein JVT61DRAFT_10935 [Boletus reticuloceps]|uniref:Uncharacterized protein n=1 Tax=Boletus reticuloceps TaxID=495285 RepID=A0A8I3A544_9AGAM|nr:hypothetical protein JVT61DRAFT_10935 [Boletus reticuloceps]